MTVGISPPVNPMTRIRPSCPRARIESVNLSPPTGSTTTSTPFPPVSSFTASLKPSGAMASDAPACSARSRFSSVEATAITRAPIAVANWVAAIPIPPPAPCTSTVSPACSRPRWASAKCTVSTFIGTDAPCVKLRLSGSGNTCDGSVATTSAKPPSPGKAHTRSPADRPEPSGAERTTPAISEPGTNGSGGDIWYLPRVCRTSGKVTPEAWTSMTTCPSPASGSGMSTTSRAAGPSWLEMWMARMRSIVSVAWTHVRESGRPRSADRVHRACSAARRRVLVRRCHRYITRPDATTT